MYDKATLYAILTLFQSSPVTEDRCNGHCSEQRWPKSSSKVPRVWPVTRFFFPHNIVNVHLRTGRSTLAPVRERHSQTQTATGPRKQAAQTTRVSSKSMYLSKPNASR